jgi:predicted O-methyltransferase YrrM
MLKNFLLCFFTIFSFLNCHASLDQYLESNNYYLKSSQTSSNATAHEGFMSDSQKNQFVSELKSYSNIETILEVGLNGGHSAEVFFENTSNLKKFYSFDINHHPYTSCAVDYFSSLFPNQFVFIEGDSTQTLKNYPNDIKMDLIYIDGDHRFEGCYSDIKNAARFAKENTILWIDDYNGSVRKAVNLLQKEQLIEVIKVFKSNDKTSGRRIWVKCRYKNINNA